MRKPSPKLATITLRTLAADIRGSIKSFRDESGLKTDNDEIANALSVWHALIAQTLQRLNEPNTTPTEKEIDEHG